jgi:hypothetical protein
VESTLPTKKTLKEVIISFTKWKLLPLTKRVSLLFKFLSRVEFFDCCAQRSEFAMLLGLALSPNLELKGKIFFNCFSKEINESSG